MKVAVLGCSGTMGAFFARYFLGQGYEVTGFDPHRAGKRLAGVRLSKSNAEAVRGAGLVIVAVPAERTVEVVREVLPALSREATLVEITSVKGATLGELREVLAPKKVSLLSLHPLFGPLARLKNSKICVIGGGRDVLAARRLFPQARLIRMEARNHDKLIAYTLSLTHLTNIAFVSALAKGIGVRRFERTAPPLGSTQLNLGKAVLSQDPSLLARIQVDNPFVTEVLSAVITELEDLKRAVAKGDVVSLEGRFAALSGQFVRAELDRALQGVYLGLNSTAPVEH